MNNLKSIKILQKEGDRLDVIKIRSVFLWHNMHQYQLHGSHTERQLGILTGNRKSKREINSQKVFQLFPVWESRIFSCIRKNRMLFTPPLKSGNKQTTTDLIIVIFSLQRFSPHRFFSTQRGSPLYKSHSQMLGKFEYTLPAKF